MGESKAPHSSRDAESSGEPRADTVPEEEPAPSETPESGPESSADGTAVDRETESVTNGTESELPLPDEPVPGRRERFAEVFDAADVGSSDDPISREWAGPEEVLDERLEQRQQPLDMETIGSGEFGLHLESEASLGRAANDAEEPKTETAPARRDPVDEPVELDADLDCPDPVIPADAPEQDADAERNDIAGTPGSDLRDTATESPRGAMPSPETPESIADAALGQAPGGEELSVGSHERPAGAKRIVGFVAAAAVVGLALLAAGLLFRPVVPPDRRIPEGVRVEAGRTASGVLQNVHHGPVFVLTGDVHNGSSTPVSGIRVTAQLFDRWGFSKSETVYCGRVMESGDLVQMKAAAIRERLTGRKDLEKRRTVVEPGQRIPFQAVFFDLPEDLDRLDRFTVTVVRNAP